MARRTFTVVIEKDEDGFYVASVVELPGCHTQARSLDELMRRVEEAIELYLDAAGEVPGGEVVGVQFVTVDAKKASSSLFSVQNFRATNVAEGSFKRRR